MKNDIKIGDLYIIPYYKSIVIITGLDDRVIYKYLKSDNPTQIGKIYDNFLYQPDNWKPIKLNKLGQLLYG